MALRAGVAGVPGAWSTEQMCAALVRQGFDTFSFSLGDCLHDLASGRVLHGPRDLGDLDAVIVKKLGEATEPGLPLRLHMLRALESRGVRMFSRPDAIERAMDRYRMHMELQHAGLPLPRTFSFEGPAMLREAMSELGSAVVKPVYTSKGRGMVRLDSASDVDGFEGNGDRERMLLQQFVQSPGRDIGACVLGGTFIGAFARVARAGEWMTTTAAGGRYAPCELPPEGIRLAERASAVFGLDYTVVDLVETDGGYQLYEVSAFGGFRGLWESVGQDVAASYALYVRRSMAQ